MAQGTIELICGCMFSGKSELLLARLRAARSEGRPAAAFKHAADDRYGRHQIITHSGRRADAVAVGAAQEIVRLAGVARLVLIDEAQFFDSGLPEVCLELAEQGRDVVVAGLDLNSWGQPFLPVQAVAAIAASVIHTQGVCACCGATADRTQRVTPIQSGRMVGGPESYESRCARCFSPPPDHPPCDSRQEDTEEREEL